MSEKQQDGLEHLYFLKLTAIAKEFFAQGFSFWMICGYLIAEYVRPQSIISFLDGWPFAQVFIFLSIVGWFFSDGGKWAKSPVNKWLVIYGVLIVVSGSLAYYSSFSKRHYIYFFQWFVVYFLIINIVNTRERFYIFLLIFCLASFKLSLFGAKSWVLRGFSFTPWGLMGPPGYFQNSGELSIQMLVFFPVAYYLYDAVKGGVSKWEKYILVLFFITPVMTILGASSRGAQLALLVQFILMFYKHIFKPKPLVYIGVIVFLVVNFFPKEQLERFSTAGDDKTSQQRLLYWEHGIDMMRDNPLLGVGYYNFIPYYEDNFPEDMLYGFAELPHNIFIQVGTDVGFIGLAVYLLIITGGYFASRKTISLSRDEDPFSANIAKGLWIGIVGFVVAGQFVTVGYYPFLWVQLSLIVAQRNVVGLDQNDSRHYKR